MEQSLWEKLKRVKIQDILHVWKFFLALLLSFFYKKKRPDLWVLCDTEMEARDNAYWLFKYIKENHPKRDVVYAIDKKSPDYARVAALGEVVDYGSLRHWLYYLIASKNISSQKSGKPNAALCYVLEIYGIIKNKRAFLQHGIIMADLSYLYYPHTKISLFVTSTQEEWKYISDRYGYPEGYVQELGLCRFDQLHDFKVRKNQILIMPTWRMYIRNEISAADPEQEALRFRETDYFKYWEGLLEHPEFLSLIKREQLQVVFYPHREMQRFLKYFQVQHPNITVASWPEYDVQELLKESAFLVTDFSSVALDFAYMKKPLLYYQFDNEKYRSSHNAAGYFEFERDGFGPLCKSVEDVIANLKKSCENQFQNQELYLQRHSKYFDLWDAQNCKRNYEAIDRL